MVLTKAARLPVSTRAGASDNVAPGSARGYSSVVNAVAAKAGRNNRDHRARTWWRPPSRPQIQYFLLPRAERGARLFRAPSRATCHDRQQPSPRSGRCPKLRDTEKAAYNLGVSWKAAVAARRVEWAERRRTAKDPLRGESGGAGPSVRLFGVSLCGNHRKNSGYGSRRRCR